MNLEMERLCEVNDRNITAFSNLMKDMKVKMVTYNPFFQHMNMETECTLLKTLANLVISYKYWCQR